MTRKLLRFVLLAELYMMVWDFARFSLRMWRGDLTSTEQRHWAEFIYGQAYGYGETAHWTDS